MPTQVRRPKTAGGRLYRPRYPLSTMEVSSEYQRQPEHIKYIPPSTSLHRSVTAVQTDHDPEFTPLVPLQQSTSTQTEPRPTTPKQAPPRPQTVGFAEDLGAAADQQPSVNNYTNFYQKLANDMARQKPNLHNRFYQDPGAPVFRAGRLGAPWRHIKQCTGNLGNHICFVDERSQAQTNTQTKPQTNRGVVGSSYISPNSAAPQSSNHLSHSFDLACQNRGRYGPKQHLVECTGNTGSNLVHIRGVENNPPVPANENEFGRSKTMFGQQRGRYGSSQNLTECTGSSGANLVYVRGEDPVRPSTGGNTAREESAIQAGTYRGSYRGGRLGPFEHVVQVTASSGNNMAFINPSGAQQEEKTGGVVKHGDMQQFPPHGSLDAQLDSLAYVSPRASAYARVPHPMNKSARYTDYTPRATDMNRYRTSYNEKARKGFRYWQEEAPYQGLPAKQTISGRLMAKGIGC